MKLALVSLAYKENDPPLGLAYIASYLRKYANFDNIVIIDKEDPIKKIRKEKPDVIGISSMSFEFQEAKKVAIDIKKIDDIPLIIGGHHVSLMPSHFDSTKFDIAVIGEGEQTFLELMKIFEKHGNFPEEELKKVNGIIFRENGKVKNTPSRALIENIDSIPHPARDLLKMKEYYVTIRSGVFGEFGLYTSMLTSRGCPYNCAFCSTRVFWQRARTHSPTYVVEEMKNMIDEYSLDGILIFDDLFIANKQRVKEISQLVKQEFGDKIKFWVLGRANMINDEICQTLKAMNVSTIEFGFESGSDKILNYLKGGTVTVKDNWNALKLCKEYGFRTIASFIIGSPGETEADLQKTLKLVNSKDLDMVHVYQLRPFPGTKVWKEAKKMGIVSDEPDLDLSKLFLMSPYKPDMLMTGKITKEKFGEWFDMFQKIDMKKRYRLQRGMFRMKSKHIKHIFTKRFATKLLFNWRILLSYMKNSISRKV